jgi:phosphatidylserine/phosphatidylglycerophosphate/cardiolipin synthase-like enzyme
MSRAPWFTVPVLPSTVPTCSSSSTKGESFSDFARHEDRTAADDLAMQGGELVIGWDDAWLTSDPTAVPGYVAPPSGVAKPRAEDRIPQQAIFSPPGAANILMVRATAINDLVGDFENELLTAGKAIIHDKVVVIDPLDEKNSVVITGSHNLGFKASYANDENMVIVKGNAKLAQAYAVHALDVFDHFRFRAVLEQQKREAVLARLESEAIAERDGSAPPPLTKDIDVGAGYLSTDADWQGPYFSGPKLRELDYFLGA